MALMPQGELSSVPSSVKTTGFPELLPILCDCLALAQYSSECRLHCQLGNEGGFAISAMTKMASQSVKILAFGILFQGAESDEIGQKSWITVEESQCFEANGYPSID